jgi:hypothetical protein
MNKNIRKNQEKINKEFFSSDIWTNYKSKKQKSKQDKKDDIIAERLTHNKVIDPSGLNYKQRARLRYKKKKNESNSNMV